MEDKILVMITAGSEEQAEQIAKTLLEERLIACANLIVGIRSLYRWKGQVCDDREILLFCKTRRELFSRLSGRVKSIHSYDVPEIIALPLLEGWQPYLEWVDQETTSA
jgi:periplasmic divalent cation tolerance protein